MGHEEQCHESVPPQVSRPDAYLRVSLKCSYFHPRMVFKTDLWSGRAPWARESRESSEFQLKAQPEHTKKSFVFFRS